MFKIIISNIYINNNNKFIFLTITLIPNTTGSKNSNMYQGEEGENSNKLSDLIVIFKEVQNVQLESNEALEDIEVEKSDNKLTLFEP